MGELFLEILRDVTHFIERYRTFGQENTLVSASSETMEIRFRYFGSTFRIEITEEAETK